MQIGLRLRWGRLERPAHAATAATAACWVRCALFAEGCDERGIGGDAAPPAIVGESGGDSVRVHVTAHLPGGEAQNRARHISCATAVAAREESARLPHKDRQGGGTIGGEAPTRWTRSEEEDRRLLVITNWDRGVACTCWKKVS